MSNIKNDCDTIQHHIKKAKFYLNMFMYTNNWIYFNLMRPFVSLHKKHFIQVEDSIKIINDYIVENNIDFKLDPFEELQNSSVLYSQSQLGALTTKQYEKRLDYLNKLDEKIYSLKEVI